MKNQFDTAISTNRKIISIWSPTPFDDYAQCTKFCLDQLNHFSDIISINCRYGWNERLSYLLSASDLIIVVLPQDFDTLTHFFSGPLFRQANCLCIVGGYDSMDPLNLQAIRKNYRIDSEKLCALSIPQQQSRSSTIHGKTADSVQEGAITQNAAYSPDRIVQEPRATFAICRAIEQLYYS